MAKDWRTDRRLRRLEALLCVDLLGIQTMGLRNVLLITGDPPKLGEYPDATGVFDLDSVALTQLTEELNRGLDIAGNELPQQLSLTIGVGANTVASEGSPKCECRNWFQGPGPGGLSTRGLVVVLDLPNATLVTLVKRA